MSIEKSWEGGERCYTPTCDGCGDELVTEYDFYDAVDAKKAAGWKSVRINGEWEDYCPECMKRLNRAIAMEELAGVGRS